MWRELTSLKRNTAVITAQFSSNVFQGGVQGLIYLQVSDSGVKGVQDRIGCFFLMSMLLQFSNMSAMVKLFLSKTQFCEERHVGYYHVLPYFVTQLMTDLCTLLSLIHISEPTRPY
eukprot:TRINITY_DN4483_c0_g1_i1.p1 TRINITY_DN4483_c0_g1~~TRINITY_DN4483_c0_g1_i1.p1  ORF type:complete len:116 (+),score=23.48 TRINITY_DN4483_c0_g1_i1:205-552(+)